MIPILEIIMTKTAFGMSEHTSKVSCLYNGTTMVPSQVDESLSKQI